MRMQIKMTTAAVSPTTSIMYLFLSVSRTMICLLSNMVAQEDPVQVIGLTIGRQGGDKKETAAANWLLNRVLDFL